MNDLLKRADLAIRESRIARSQTHKDLANASRAAAQVRAMVRLARIEGVLSVSLYCEIGGQTCAGIAGRPQRSPRTGCSGQNTSGVAR